MGVMALRSKKVTLTQSLVIGNWAMLKVELARGYKETLVPPSLVFSQAP